MSIIRVRGGGVVMTLPILVAALEASVAPPHAAKAGAGSES